MNEVLGCVTLDISSLKRQWFYFNKSINGNLDLFGFETFCKALNIPYDQDDVENLFKIIDQDDSG